MHDFTPPSVYWFTLLVAFGCAFAAGGLGIWLFYTWMMAPGLTWPQLIYAYPWHVAGTYGLPVIGWLISEFSGLGGGR